MGTANATLWLVQLGIFAAAAGLGWWAFLKVDSASRRYGERFNRSVGAQLGRAHVFIDPTRLLTLNLVTVVAVTALIAWATGSALIAFIAALLAGFMPRLTLAWLRYNRRERFRQQLPDLMLLTAAGLRAGSSLWQALAQTSAELAPPARQEIELMLREQRLGVAFEQALAGLERRMNIEEMQLMAASLRISHDTGGNLAETLESLADSSRRKLALEGKVRALTAQGKLQGWIMGLLPLLLAAVLFQIEPQAMSALFTTVYGLGVTALVIVLQVLGLYFVRRIVAVDV